MSTTVDDLIELKDQGCGLAYQVAEGVLAVFGESAEGVMGELLINARAVIERAELYDKADADDRVCSIDEYEEKGIKPCPVCGAEGADESCIENGRLIDDHAERGA